MYAIHAPAKVNLYLHVGPVRPDGRHPLDSLVVFSDALASDIIRFTPSEAPLSLEVCGAMATPEIGAAEDNLILRAARALSEYCGMAITGELVLEKRLPIAAGIGGGSSDAAATLLMLNAVCGLGLDIETLIDLARPLGGDVPACVVGAPVLMRGDGDRVEPLGRALPELSALLIRPDIACPTGPVFRAFDQLPPITEFMEVAPPDGASAKELIGQLKAGYRNDLGRAAMGIVPAVKAVLDRLSDLVPDGFVAMSGSGATCFALLPEAGELARLSGQLQAEFPGSWVISTKLGQAAFDPLGFSL